MKNKLDSAFLLFVYRKCIEQRERDREREKERERERKCNQKYHARYSFLEDSWRSFDLIFIKFSDSLPSSQFPRYPADKLVLITKNNKTLILSFVIRELRLLKARVSSSSRDPLAIGANRKVHSLSFHTNLRRPFTVTRSRNKEEEKRTEKRAHGREKQESGREEGREEANLADTGFQIIKSGRWRRALSWALERRLMLRKRKRERKREREKTKRVTGVRYIYTPLPAHACTRVRQSHAAVSPSCCASSSSMMIRRLSSLISPPLAAARSRSRPVSCQMRRERRMGGDDPRSPSFSFPSLYSLFLRSSVLPVNGFSFFFFLFFFSNCSAI